MSFRFWQRWLIALGVGVTLFGIAQAFFSGTALFGIFYDQYNPVFWGAAAPTAETVQFQQWAFAVWGGTIAGWGVFITLLAAYPFGQRAKWAWLCFLDGLLLWYVLDTGASVAYGVGFNVVFNTALLVLGMVPLAMTWREFFTSRRFVSEGV
ncbi:MAG: hypothetical protein D6712_04225 [Chloroflexi bacterium]|nr:MAG: hypothetical protein D6712_04225 [Chloroflexota bacterium]